MGPGEVYGSNRALWQWLEGRAQAFVLAIQCTERLRVLHEGTRHEWPQAQLDGGLNQATSAAAPRLGRAVATDFMAVYLKNFGLLLPPHRGVRASP